MVVFRSKISSLCVYRIALVMFEDSKVHVFEACFELLVGRISRCNSGILLEFVNSVGRSAILVLLCIDAATYTIFGLNASRSFNGGRDGGSSLGSSLGNMASVSSMMNQCYRA